MKKTGQLVDQETDQNHMDGTVVGWFDVTNKILLNLLIDQGRAIDAIVTRSSLTFDLQNGRSCTCETLSSCKWSQNIIETAKRLPRNSRSRKSIIKIVKARICPENKKAVYCCNGEIPADYEVKELNEGPKTQDTDSIPVRKSPKPRNTIKVTSIDIYCVKVKLLIQIISILIKSEILGTI